MKLHSTDALVRELARVRDDSLVGMADRPAARRLLDGVMTLPAPPGGRGRAAVRRVVSPRAGVRLVAVGALAVAIAAGATVAQNLGGADEKGRPRPIVPGVPAGPVANAAEALNRAATATESDPFTAPRPDQWIFVENKQRFPAIGTRVNGPRTPLVNFVERTWWRADGRQIAREQEGHYGDGKLQIENGGGGWKHHYPTLATLPTDPDALRDWIMAEPGFSDGTDEQLYDEYSAILRNGVAPPKLEAAVFRAVAKIPGVTLQKNAVTVDGRPAIAVARIAEGYLHKEILLDRTTYRYLAERIIAIKDHTSTGNDGTWSVRKGAVLNLEIRTGTGIVDTPGRRP